MIYVPVITFVTVTLIKCLILSIHASGTEKKINFRINFLNTVKFVVHKRLLEQLLVNESLY